MPAGPPPTMPTDSGRSTAGGATTRPRPSPPTLALGAELLGDEPLERPDRDRAVDRAPAARVLTRRGAHAAAHRRERVGQPGRQVGELVVAVGDRRHVHARRWCAPGRPRGTGCSRRSNDEVVGEQRPSDPSAAVGVPQRPRGRRRGRRSTDADGDEVLQPTGRACDRLGLEHLGRDDHGERRSCRPR